MLTRTFQRKSEINVPVGKLRDWHFRSGAFTRLNPPWEKADLVEIPESLENGACAVIKVGAPPFQIKWIAEHHLIDDGFLDRQISGPFSEWVHRHHFTETDSGSTLTDAITYRLPFGFPGDFFGNPLIKQKLERMFRYRHDVTRSDLERNTENPPPKALTVLITGATGMIGAALTGYLQTQGHRVFGITRNPKSADDIFWDPKNGTLEIPESVQADAVVHLAGENVASGRWTPEKRAAILKSRTQGTKLITEAVLKLKKPPAVFVTASGSGYYELGGEVHDESSPAGTHFLSEVCQQWEGETKPLEAAGIRVVQARIGVVLSPAGGALAKILPIFNLGLGGKIGGGDQRMAWISLDDVIDILHRTLFEDSWKGPLNLVAPEIITNRDFTKTLATILRRPAVLPVPTFVIESLFGEMGRETILADVAVAPKKLNELGYQFRHPDLESALRHVIGKY